ncbi:conserved hypothetical protein, secreted [Candidatus Thiomargarita nelsonii]|uniref:Secreted protein n=1 Tax=Candidatus Thiomargarita nelsonii TaxID=1003181 RepID=A0A176S666_9GAMM|nr:conserved hypothetical protein, secreted [Candidatus Thiomargarita nelsonii]
MKDNAQRLLSIIVTAAFLSMPVIAETAPATQLESIENCPALLAELRETAIEEMEERLDANRQRIIQGDGCPKSIISFVILASPDSATEYSVTNVQTADVDEADFVKNDGAYIYTLANGKFRIVDAWPPEKAYEIAAFDIEGTPKKMFVYDGRAFIYSSLDTTGDGRELKITVLDIEDVAAPSLLREMRFSGAYLNSRRIGNAIYSVVIFPGPQIAGLDYWPDDLCETSLSTSLSEAEITAKFEALKAENRELIQSSADNSDWLPTMTDIRYNDGVPQENHALFENCNNFYRTEQKDGTNFLSIISTDINGTASLNATTIMGKPGAVYASNSALYVAARHSQNSVQSPWFFGDEAQIDGDSFYNGKSTYA